VKGALRALLFLIRVCPRAWFDAFASLLLLLLRPFAGRELRYLAGNVQRVYGLPPGTVFADMFEAQNLRHQVICALETLRAVQDPAAIRVSGLTELRALVAAAEAQNRGHLLVTAHLGSWELCAHYGHEAGTRPFHVLAKPSKFPAATAVLDGLRRGMGTPVLWTDRKTLLRDMLAAMRRAEALGFVMDQKPEGRQGPVVPVLGVPTEFVSGPAAMAARFDCAVIGIFCLRVGPFAYRLVSESILAAGHGIKDELDLTRRMAASIERVIRLYPEQWTWNYKRWKTAP
jgi:KDO2-lipid IV(A) lauroyltransferase